MSEPYIIAEIGSNWISLQGCIDSIWQAKECGADAVKFQMFTHEELYGVPGDDTFDLPRGFISELAQHCKAIDIDFMCTAFTADGVKFIDPFVKMHKVASSSASNEDLTDCVFKNTPSFDSYTLDVAFAGSVMPFVKLYTLPYFMFAANVEFVRTKPCPSASSIMGLLSLSRATDSMMSGFEKSTPVSTTATVTPFPVTS